MAEKGKSKAPNPTPDEAELHFADVTDSPKEIAAESIAQRKENIADEISFAKEMYESLQYDEAKDALLDMVAKDRRLARIGVPSMEELIELAHLDLRRALCARDGMVYDEDSRKTHFVCPVNYHHHITKYGYARGHIPRYKCRECGGPPYHGLVGSILYNKQMPLDKLHLFIGFLIQGMPALQIAERCNLDKDTANEWRHLIFYAVGILLKGVKLTGTIEADETYFPTSYRGKNVINTEGVLRPARVRGGVAKREDTYKDKIGVVCAVDEKRQCVARVTGIGMPTALRIATALGDAIDVNHDGYFVTDGGRALAAFAKMHKLNHLQLISQEKDGEYRPGIRWINDVQYSVQNVNAMHSSMIRTLRKYSGVSTKYLQGYLDMFCYHYMHPDLTINDSYIDILKVLVTPKYHLPKEGIDEYYQAYVYGNIKNKRLAEFATSAEIELYGRYKNREPKEYTCADFDCGEEYYDGVVSKFNESKQMAMLAVNQYEREKSIYLGNVKASERNAEIEARDKDVVARYLRGENVKDIMRVHSISRSYAYLILNRAKNSGIDFSKRPIPSKFATGKQDVDETRYRRYRLLKKELPGLRIKDYAAMLAEEDGLGDDTRAILNRAASISRMRMKHGDKKEHNVIPKSTWVKIEADFLALVAKKESTTKAINMLSRRYRIPWKTIRYHLSVNGFFVKLHEDDVKVDNAELAQRRDELYLLAVENDWTKDDIYEILKNETGLATKEAVKARLKKYDRKNGIPPKPPLRRKPHHNHLSKAAQNERDNKIKAEFKKRATKLIKKHQTLYALRLALRAIAENMAPNYGITADYLRKIVRDEYNEIYGAEQRRIIGKRSQGA